MSSLVKTAPARSSTVPPQVGRKGPTCVKKFFRSPPTPSHGYRRRVSRYELGTPGDDEFEPGSDRKALRNRLGLTNASDVDRREAALLALAQGRSYGQIDTGTRITVELIRGLHRSCLGSIYEFAGEVRTVDLAKDTVRFAPVADIETSLR